MTRPHAENPEPLCNLSPTSTVTDQELIAMMIGRRASKHVGDDVGELASATYPELVARGL
ncbi:MAG: hypothetical protein H7Z43_05825, partial [Clostridia bacterium]|nr:hypothetical protein [Deltaproteobacteria bacterium]